MYSVVIIDDEQQSRGALKNLIKEYCPDVRISGEADGVESGFSLIRETNPDAVFLDIRMNDGIGFDLIDRFPNPSFNVIFTTAYQDYAISAFKVNAIDYLLKPINPDELVKAVEKLSLRDSSSPGDGPGFIDDQPLPEATRIALPTSKGWALWELEDIIRLEAYDNMTFFYHYKGEKILVAKNIGAYQDILPREKFFRCHKSHIVNKKYVKEVLRQDGAVAVLEDHIEISISRRRMKYFLEWLWKGNIQ